jgi:F-type H+-transporting ATPase subunit b
MQELLKLLSENELIAQIISFLVLFFLLRAFAWKNILGLLDERKEKIASEFRNIEETKASVAGLKKDFEEKIKSIDDIRRVKTQEAILEGQRLREELSKSAKEDAEKILEHARSDIRYEIVKAKEEIKNDVVDLVITTTERVLETRLTEGDDKKIIESFLNKVDKLE